MNIQDSPKQIALTAEQINGIKNKYTSMIGSLDPAPAEQTTAVAQAPVVENPTPATPESNLFDAAPINQNVSAVNGQTETSVNPAPNQDVNMFDQTINSAPTNAEIIGANQNVFDTSNVFETATVPVEPVNTVEANIFDTNSSQDGVQTIPSEPVSVNQSEPTVQTNNAAFENLVRDYNEITETMTKLHGMIESFNNKLLDYRNQSGN